MSEQLSKAAALRARLDVHKPALAMAAHNPLAAKLAADAGFDAIWGSGSDIYVVGAGGTILHRSPAGWKVEASGTDQTLRSVWGNSKYIYAVGDRGTIVYRAR